MNPLHFALTRIALGAYLTVHFFALIQYSQELFSSCGVIPDTAVLPAAKVMGGILQLLSACWIPPALLALLTALSALLALGVCRRIVALILWAGWAYLVARNPFISNPGIPFVGLLLLIFAVVPGTEPFRIMQRNQNRTAANDFYFPKFLWIGFWVLMAVSYTISGIHKLGSPSWIDGSALSHLMSNPLSRTSLLTDGMRALPDFVLQLLTWSSLALEMLFAPLCLFRRTRILAWSAMVGMHVGIVGVIDFADLTFGMLLVHLFTFDPTWLVSDKRPLGSHVADPAPRNVIFFDGDCGLCNGFIQKLFRADPHGIFSVGSLQGDTARTLLPKEYVTELSSIVVRLADGTTRRKSDAIISIAQHLGGVYDIFQLGVLIPRTLRDSIYDIVARNRHRFILGTKVCERPTPETANRILP